MRREGDRNGGIKEDWNDEAEYYGKTGMVEYWKSVIDNGD